MFCQLWPRKPVKAKQSGEKASQTERRGVKTSATAATLTENKTIKDMTYKYHVCLIIVFIIIHVFSFPQLIGIFMCLFYAQLF